MVKLRKAADLSGVEAKIDIIDTNVDSILTDTGTTIPGTITTLNNNVTTLGTSALETESNASSRYNGVYADVKYLYTTNIGGAPATTSISKVVTDILEDTNTTIPGRLDTIDSEITALGSVALETETDAASRHTSTYTNNAQYIHETAISSPTTDSVAHNVQYLVTAALSSPTAGSMGDLLQGIQASLGLASSGKTWFVAKTGSDLNAGTADAPFLTIQKAHDSASSADVIVIDSGTYDENTTADGLWVTKGQLRFVAKSPFQVAVKNSNVAATSTIRVSENSIEFTNIYTVGEQVFSGGAANGWVVDGGTQLNKFTDCAGILHSGKAWDLNGTVNILINCFGYANFNVTGGTAYDFYIEAGSSSLMLTNCSGLGIVAGNGEGFYFADSGATYNQLMGCRVLGKAVGYDVAATNALHIEDCRASNCTINRIDGGTDIAWINFNEGSKIVAGNSEQDDFKAIWDDTKWLYTVALDGSEIDGSIGDYVKTDIYTNNAQYLATSALSSPVEDTIGWNAEFLETKAISSPTADSIAHNVQYLETSAVSSPTSGSIADIVDKIKTQYSHNNVIYVDSAATGVGDGTSWTDAYTDPWTAFAALNPNDLVIIAGGTYTVNTQTPTSIDDAGVNVVGIGNVILNNSSSASDHIFWLYATDIILDNLKFYSNAQSKDFVLGTSNGCRIKNCWFYGKPYASSGDKTVLNCGPYWTVEDCIFSITGTTTNIIYQGPYGGSSYNNLILNNNGGTITNAIYITTGDGNSFSNVKIGTCTTGVKIDSGGTNNSFHDITFGSVTTPISNSGGATNIFVNCSENSQITADNTVQDDFKAIYDDTVYIHDSALSSPTAASIGGEVQYLNGVAMTAPIHDSIGESVISHDKHFHTRERWLGISADQSGSDWALDTLNPFVATSGLNTYGTAVKVLGTSDTPVITNKEEYDMHRIIVIDVTADTVYKLRFIYGTGTSADAITAKQFTECMVLFDSTNPQLSAGIPVDIRMPKLTAGSYQIWCQAWNVTNNATISFLIGLHEYDVPEVP